MSGLQSWSSEGGVVCIPSGAGEGGGVDGSAAVAAASSALNEYRQGRLANSRRCIDSAAALCASNGSSASSTPTPPEPCPSNISATIRKWASLLPLASGRAPSGLGARGGGEAAVVGGRSVVHNLEGTRIRDLDSLAASNFGELGVCVCLRAHACMRACVCTCMHACMHV